MKGKMKTGLKFAALVLALVVLTAAFAGGAEAAKQAYKASVEKYETFKGDDGIMRVRIHLKIMNTSSSNIVKVYDVQMTTNAKIKSSTSGNVYDMQAKTKFDTLGGDSKYTIEPGDSKTFKINVKFTSFKDPTEKWKWEGEEKSGKPPLTDFKVSKFSAEVVTKK
jgi:hypothetical protein